VSEIIVGIVVAYIAYKVGSIVSIGTSPLAARPPLSDYSADTGNPIGFRP